MSITGREVVVEVLRTEGVTHVFGNPGTTELPLMDALAEQSEIEYVLGLQEATCVGMADGYAQATGRPAFVNLHTSAGLGNAIGQLTNAQANGTPLVITAGQQDYRHIAADPLLAGDLVGLARSVSKWAHEVRTIDELAVILRRAFHDAASPPTGPVFVSLPMNIIDETTDTPVIPPSRIARSSVAGGLDELADLLLSTDPTKLAIVAGDEVSASGAIDALVAVAEALGCTVHASPLHSTTVFPARHPLYAGPLAPMAAAIAPTLAAYERVLLVGGRAFMVYPYSPGSALPATVELLHLSPDAGQLGRTYPTRLGLVGDPKATLEALLPLLGSRVTGDAANGMSEPSPFEATALGRYDDVPMHPMAAAHALLRALPPDTAVVDEAITTGTYVRGFHQPSIGGRYYFCRGGGLGWGMPAALGVSLGLDRAPVLCVVGDGSAMYSPQALWTAAHDELPVVFAVVNNRQYLILKNALRGRGGAATTSGRMLGMDIIDPPIDYCALAASMGVASTNVERAGEVGDTVRAAIEAGRPHLLELPISVA